MVQTTFVHESLKNGRFSYHLCRKYPRAQKSSGEFHLPYGIGKLIINIFFKKAILLVFRMLQLRRQQSTLLT